MTIVELSHEMCVFKLRAPRGEGDENQLRNRNFVTQISGLLT